MVFKALGVLPWRESIYYFMQRNITRSLIVSRDMLISKLQTAIEYLKFIEKIIDVKEFNDITHFDIGAGWMPTIPLLFYSVGFEQQILCDINYKLHYNIVFDVISIFNKVVLQERNFGSHCKRLPPLISPR